MFYWYFISKIFMHFVRCPEMASEPGKVGYKSLILVALSLPCILLLSVWRLGGILSGPGLVVVGSEFILASLTYSLSLQKPLDLLRCQGNLHPCL